MSLALLACSHGARVEPAHAAAPPQVSVASGPPIAPIRPVTDTYFGTTIVDPYRWMEASSPELDAWMKAQAEHTTRKLAALPLRAALRERVQSLAHGAVQVRSVERRGSSLFYLKLDPGAEVYKLYTRELDGAAERCLVDPGQRSSAADKYAIDYFEASPDGSHVAYGLSPNGSEMAVIHIVETATGRELPEQIDRARWAFPRWQPDGRGFFYTRLRALPSDAPESERFIKAPVYLHKLGAPIEQDVTVFGYGVAPQIDVPAEADCFVIAPVDGAYIFALFSEGVRPAMAMYAARREKLAGPRTPWRKVLDQDDGISDFEVHADTLYLVSQKNAPRRKLLRLELNAREPENLARAELLLPESDAVIRWVASAQDALYVQLLDEGLGRIQRIAHGKGPARAQAEDVPLPVAGTIRQMSATAAHPGVLLELTSWTLAPRLYRFDPVRRELLDTRAIPDAAVSFSGVHARETKAHARDGTLVPLSIIARSDLAKDQTHPTLLYAYGAYGSTLEPRFEPMRLAWLERGGVYAVCHARGGGELGEGWHAAGMLETKPNTISDVLACADHLIAERITSPAQLALEGTSAGGIPAANALVRRPAGFGAVVIRVGMTNALRFEQIPIGPLNTSEFGSVQTEAGFRMLLAIDAYQQVQPRGDYPAVLLTTGITDPRVSPWQAAKMTARLQAASSSGRPVLLRVDYGAGHGWGSSRSTETNELADEYAFLFSQLGAARPGL